MRLPQYPGQVGFADRAASVYVVYRHSNSAELRLPIEEWRRREL